MGTEVDQDHPGMTTSHTNSMTIAREQIQLAADAVTKAARLFCLVSDDHEEQALVSAMRALRDARADYEEILGSGLEELMADASKLKWERAKHPPKKG